ncbi:MAG: motif family protein [Acidobacteriota bacterium]|jgi:Spy/CpxP family protein refolding chaperone|nr:motif family protein [Acidobacteriota bacterium]
MKKVLTAAILTLAASFAAVAQQQQQSPAMQGPAQSPGARPEARRMGPMRMRMRMRRQGAQALGRLNLSEQQSEKLRSMRQDAFKATQSQRDELRRLFQTRRDGGELTPEQQARAKQLREELRAARQHTRDNALAVLTPEQRTQLEQLKQERKARREQFRQRREEFRQRRMQMRDGQQPTQP